ncbi:WD40-repeat-containing domain protein [Neohortaea acidophila]|uniref:WD40-repeat-containing domain protein n=1 Tax=Neohortaea acidophila TaxID=245834 RepID=A0A6A6PVX7_9PEZI|nr:WD40-repeat-containing domain protein [Neohortaea acidophila]KAF2483891.1 WD40-repeat-containing domain protein [Neohortaea acidophila]
MPPADSSALIVARFLKSNHYTNSYDAFINEAGLPASAGDVGKGDLTLETLLEEKKTFDVSVRYEKLGSEDGEGKGWARPAPSKAMAVTTLPSKSNLLSTSVELFDEAGTPQPLLLVTSADRRLHILDVPACSLRASLPAVQDSPILSCAVLNKHTLLTTSMSGQLVASNLSGDILASRRDHSKYVVKVAVYPSPTPGTPTLIATAGWDNKINIYVLPNDTSPLTSLPEPHTTIPLQSKPESLLFLPHPDNPSEPLLLLSRTDSNHLYYYTTGTTTTTNESPRLLGTQNLAPHSNAWIAFTPTSLALHPHDPSLLAAGTNSLPHMKLLIIRLLVPPLTTPTIAAPLTQASQARAALAIADKESAAILIHANTLAPQTPYSTPAIAWRPDGSGVWVNGDDGVVRGVEAGTGKVVAMLKGEDGGHEEGSKVRCLWAGMVGEEEWLVSGGFDQKLVVWKVDAP